MGIFDKLLKEGLDAVKEAVSDENKEKAKELFSNLKEQFSDEIKEIKEKVEEYKAEQANKEEFYSLSFIAKTRFIKTISKMNSTYLSPLSVV